MLQPQQANKDRHSKPKPETTKRPDPDRQFAQETGSPTIQESLLNPHLMTASQVVQLQHTIGNAAVQRLLAGSNVPGSDKQKIQETLQRKFTGDLENIQFSHLKARLKKAYDIDLTYKQFNDLKGSDTPYQSDREIALALNPDAAEVESSSVNPLAAVVEEPVVKEVEAIGLGASLKQAAQEVVVPPPKQQPPIAPKVVSSKAPIIAKSVMMAAEQVAVKQAPRKPTIDTGRVRIFAPVDDILTVYRAEKSERNTLDQRRAQGGLARWRPTSDTVQEAYDKMLQAITGGQFLGEFQFKAALNAYAQELRASGQPDNLATARTVEGAFSDDFNYTVKISGVRIFKWTPQGIGERIPAGAEIKQHYIVLNADTVADSTVFGIGHVTGTQEVSFYSEIPADMIESVQRGSFKAPKEEFVVPPVIAPIAE